MIDCAGGRLYHAYNIAFFDREGNLLACAGDAQNAWGMLLARDAVTCEMPVPREMNERVATYKAAYYEAHRGIGQAKRDEIRVGSDDASPKPEFIRPGCRPLRAAGPANWQAETKDGACSLKEAANSLDREAFSLQLGETLPVKGECRCIITGENAIQPWLSFRNESNKAVFVEAYFAFFDGDGNLAASTRCSTEVAPKLTGPLSTAEADSVKSESRVSYTAASPAPVPLGCEKSIATFKMTIYESEEPIGKSDRRSKD